MDKSQEEHFASLMATQPAMLASLCVALPNPPKRWDR